MDELTVPGDGQGLVIALTGPGLGTGDDRLGLALLANFVRLLGEKDPLPVVAVACYNKGVMHLLGDSPLLGHLKALAERGVPVIACRTCIEYFGIEDKLAVGRPGTMSEIQGLLLQFRTLFL
jgi:hypothetical protein